MRFKLLHVMPHVWFYKHKDTVGSSPSESSQSAAFVYRRSTSLKLVKSGEHGGGTHVDKGSDMVKGRASVQVCTVVDAGCTCRATVTSHHKDKKTGSRNAGSRRPLDDKRSRPSALAHAAQPYRMVSRLVCRSSSQDVVAGSMYSFEARHNDKEDALRDSMSFEDSLALATDTKGSRKSQYAADETGHRIRSSDENSIKKKMKKEGEHAIWDDDKRLRSFATSTTSIVNSSAGPEQLSNHTPEGSLCTGRLLDNNSFSSVVMPSCSHIKSLGIEKTSSTSSWIEEEFERLNLSEDSIGGLGSELGSSLPRNEGNISLSDLRASLVHKKHRNSSKKERPEDFVRTRDTQCHIIGKEKLINIDTGNDDYVDIPEIEKQAGSETDELVKQDIVAASPGNHASRSTALCNPLYTIARSATDSSEELLKPMKHSDTLIQSEYTSDHSYSPSLSSSRELECIKQNNTDDMMKDHSSSEIQVVDDGSREVFNSVAMVKSSFDPSHDFKESMLEMVLAKELRQPQELQQLLQCYLSLNAHEYHPLIIKAFQEAKRPKYDLPDVESRQGYFREFHDNGIVQDKHCFLFFQAPSGPSVCVTCLVGLHVLGYVFTSWPREGPSHVGIQLARRVKEPINQSNGT